MKREKKKSDTYELTLGDTETKKETYGELNEEKAEGLSKRVKQLEEEKHALIKQLEAIELKKSGLSPEELSKVNILSSSETQNLRRRVQECDRVLNGKSHEESKGMYQGENGYSISTRYDLFQEKQAAKQQKFLAEKTLAINSAKEVSSTERDYLKKRKQELETTLKSRIAAIGDEWDRSDSYEFNKTVNNIVLFNEQCDGMVRELKNINRILEPSNPNSGDIGYLYKTRKRNV